MRSTRSRASTGRRPRIARIARAGTLFATAALAVGCAQTEPGAGAKPLAQASPPAAPDPSVQGISGLARVSRYVFNEMSRHRAECTTAGLPEGQYVYTVEVQVDGGRIASAKLARVEMRAGPLTVPLDRPDWPGALASFVGCLEPHLLALPMDPAPADGSYATKFAATGVPGEAPGVAASTRRRP